MPLFFLLPNPADLNRRLISSYMKSHAAITIKQATGKTLFVLLFYCFQESVFSSIEKLFFFCLIIYCIESFLLFLLVGAVQSIIMHFHANPLESNLSPLPGKCFFRSFARSACILFNSNVFLMDKRIEMMKYFCAALHSSAANIAQLFICKFGISKSKIYFADSVKQLNERRKKWKKVQHTSKWNL
jgi:hypothetical protein